MLARFRVSVNALQLIDRTSFERSASMAVLSALPFFDFFLLAHCYSYRRSARKLCFETYGFVAYLELTAHRTCSLRNTPRSPIHPFRLFFANQFGYKWKRGRNRWDETFARTERKSTLSSGEVLIKNFSRSFFKDESLPVGREYSAIFCAAYVEAAPRPEIAISSSDPCNERHRSSFI